MSSTNFRSILIFASCVVGTCNMIVCCHMHLNHDLGVTLSTINSQYQDVMTLILRAIRVYKASVSGVDYASTADVIHSS